jgi:hypothetical protein
VVYNGNPFPAAKLERNGFDVCCENAPAVNKKRSPNNE